MYFTQPVETVCVSHPFDMRRENVPVRTSVAQNAGRWIVFCGRAKTLTKRLVKDGITADRTLAGRNDRILLHTSSPNQLTQENREMRADA